MSRLFLKQLIKLVSTSWRDRIRRLAKRKRLFLQRLAVCCDTQRRRAAIKKRPAQLRPMGVVKVIVKMLVDGIVAGTLSCLVESISSQIN